MCLSIWRPPLVHLTLLISVLFSFNCICFSAYFVFEMESCYVVQVSLEPLGSGGPPSQPPEHIRILCPV